MKILFIAPRFDRGIGGHASGVAEKFHISKLEKREAEIYQELIKNGKIK